MAIDWVLHDRIATPREHRRLAESVGWHDAFDWASLPPDVQQWWEAAAGGGHFLGGGGGVAVAMWSV
jgi:hypothetical protein